MPRWGMQAPMVNNLSLVVPSGLSLDMSANRLTELSDPNDLFSIESMTISLTVNGRTHESKFSGVSGQFTTTSPEGRQFVATLDSFGREAGYQLPGLAPASLIYDEKGRPAVFSNGVGTDERIFSFAYDQAGYIKSISDPLLRIISFTHDDAGNITGMLLPGNRQILYTYDANGNVTSISPPGRPPHVFSYTTVNQNESYNPPDVGVIEDQTQYTFNLDRQLTTVVRPDGKNVSLGYDSVGHLSTITYPRGNMTYNYDQTTGQLTTITTPNGSTIAYSYDGPLLTSKIWSDAEVVGSVETAYNDDFRVDEETVNGVDVVSFQYDQDGLLTGAGALTLDLNADNGLVTETTIESVTTSQIYNAFVELEDYSAMFNTTQMYTVSYVRDKLGRITEKAETVNGTTDTYIYDYDLAGRMETAAKNGIPATYAYDANGNRLSRISGGETFTGTYDNQDRLLHYGDATYTYTANGERLAKTKSGQTTTYDYDVFGNLMSVVLPDNMVVEYIVDGTNRRIGRKVNGLLVQGFLYRNQLNPVAELDGSNNVVSRFIYASRLNVPDYMEKGGNRYRIISDHLGSVRLVVDVTSGNIIQQVDYDVFGNVTSDTNPGFQPFGFAGGLYDRHTGLVRFGARDYDPETGRWTTRDPILFYGGDSNLYDYVFTDPVNFIDPTGLVAPPENLKLPPWLLDLIPTDQKTVDAVAAGGDSSLEFATFGLFKGIGKVLRRTIGTDNVDECSKTYRETKKNYDFAYKAVGVVSSLKGLSQAGRTLLQAGGAGKTIKSVGDGLGLAQGVTSAGNDLIQLFKK